MKKIGQLVLIAAATLGVALSPSLSNAAGTDSGFMIGASIMKLDTSTDGPNFGNSEESTMLLNAKVGYTLGSGLYVGGIYDSRTDETNGSKNERSGFGATLGYHKSGWFIDGSYYVSSTMKVAGGTEFTEGSGFGVDLGKNFEVTSNLYLGLQVSYKSFTYAKVGSVDATNKIKSELSPMLNIGVNF